MRGTVDDSISEIGARIKLARHREYITQEVLAESIGVTPQYLSDLECGKVGTSIYTLRKLCKSLHVSSDYLLFGDDGKEEELNSVRNIETKLEEIDRKLNLLASILNTEPCNNEPAVY